ncbi:hypothetical protein BS47DRAFT_1356927 [Hydnum rufescens UP504]|uniref:Uncharacterized protein n=1 Tax=Hydnum rufescens UP504 TaxID=1448309 RepID=A0A9P6BBC8_9AGAM|nr:hypothetical protein BS47DRAFT_1356927 [Hydnum rufescens UP504]
MQFTTDLRQKVNIHQVMDQLYEQESKANRAQVVQTYEEQMKALQEALGLPLDPAGAAWGIKGINGVTETLHGCCRKVPIEIGGLRFDHAFFIKKAGLGNDYDLLMGQPWLKAVGAEILFDGSEDSGPMKIRIFENGNKLGNSVIVNLLVDQRCEATKLIQSAELVNNSPDPGAPEPPIIPNFPNPQLNNPASSFHQSQFHP